MPFRSVELSPFILFFLPLNRRLSLITFWMNVPKIILPCRWHRILCKWYNSKRCRKSSNQINNMHFDRNERMTKRNTECDKSLTSRTIVDSRMIIKCYENERHTELSINFIYSSFNDFHLFFSPFIIWFETVIRACVQLSGHHNFLWL